MKILVDSCIYTPVEFGLVCRRKLSEWNDVIDMADGRVVVFNTLHQTAVLMNQAEYSDILYGENASQLYSMGIITNADTDERKLWNDAYQEAKHDMSYLDITVVVTEQCQFDCIYCFEGTSKSNRVITQEVAEGLLRLIKKYENVLKRLRITWFGGEPLLAYAKIQQLSHTIISYCREHGISYSSDITTNGFALSPTRIRQMVEEFCIRTYIVTLDGTKAEHDKRRALLSKKGTFDHIWQNIQTLVSLDVCVILRSTIDKRNAADIPHLIDMIAAEGWAGKVRLVFCRTIDISFTPKVTSSYIYNEYEFAEVEWNLIKYAHDRGVMPYSFPHAAPRGGCLRDGDIVVGPDGEFYKCLDTIGDSRWIFGNIKYDANELVPVWFDKWTKWVPDNMPGCRKCVLQPLCNGGCSHNALYNDKKHGTILQCPDWKANYKRQIIELINENY